MIQAILLRTRSSVSSPSNRKGGEQYTGLMKTVLPLIGALILAGACISACPAAVALVQKETTPTSLAETGAKQGGEHVAKGMMSPTPSPTPDAGQ
jgi:hypothetical protein